MHSKNVSYVADARPQGGLKPGLQPYVPFRGQTSPQVALVQWNCCIMWAKLRIRIYVIQLCIKTCKMQRFHWTRATRGDVWPRKSTHGCKPGFTTPLCSLESNETFDGCYSSKFLRSSARRFLLEILSHRSHSHVSTRTAWRTCFTSRIEDDD